ncbi:MAG: phage Gp37/Gp68 family protein [Candidatus Eisenbacteria bacterium]|nr:phage Gp37/Gp68 family protein [Candidatus Eisenbacteria bacterium]
MSDRTGIEWCDATWNPVTGCTPVSAGCENCYAARMAKRLQAMGMRGYEDGFAVTVHLDRMEIPIRWRKPRRIFVCSMGDLFHSDVPVEAISRVMKVAAVTPRHTFIVLTKRASRLQRLSTHELYPIPPNVWVGVTVENMECLWRTDYLMGTVAALRFVSCEPLLEPVVLDLMRRRWIDWVIAGCESGPGRRMSGPGWYRSLRDECVEAGVSFFLKQMEVNGEIVSTPKLDGRRWMQWPERPLGEVLNG